MKNQNGKVTGEDLPPLMVKLKAFTSMFNEEEIRGILGESFPDMGIEIDFEDFLRVSHLCQFSFFFQCLVKNITSVLEFFHFNYFGVICGRSVILTAVERWEWEMTCFVEWAGISKFARSSYCKVRGAKACFILPQGHDNHSSSHH